MQYYRVHLLDDSSRITGGFTLHCKDDQVACEEASRLCMGRKWELWSGTERIDCKASKMANAPHPESPPRESPSAEG